MLIYNVVVTAVAEIIQLLHYGNHEFELLMNIIQRRLDSLNLNSLRSPLREGTE